MMHESFHCHFYFIRHAESTGNQTPGKIGSPLDCTLSDRGKLQAQAVGHYLKEKNIAWTRVYSSHLPRALETAKIACQVLGFQEIRQTSALAEQFQGDWNCSDRQSSYTQAVLNKMGAKNSLFIPPNGESLRMVERRVSNWLEDEFLYNKSFIQQQPNAHIALFSHGMAIRCLIRYIFQSDSSITWKMKILNGSVSCMVFRPDGWHPHSINESSHLKDVGFFPN